MRSRGYRLPRARSATCADRLSLDCHARNMSCPINDDLLSKPKLSIKKIKKHQESASSGQLAIPKYTYTRRYLDIVICSLWPGPCMLAPLGQAPSRTQNAFVSLSSLLKSLIQQEFSV